MPNNIDSIAYCGLYCAECLNYKGNVADLARDLRKELRDYRFEKYNDCYEVLGGMVKLRCKNGCRNGGGNPNCKIRLCCKKKQLNGCWECPEFEICKKNGFFKDKSWLYPY